MSDYLPQRNFQAQMNKHFIGGGDSIHPPYIRSVIALLLIFPVGIASLVFCFMSNYYADNGNIGRAQDLSSAARVIANITIGIFLVLAFLIILFFGSLVLLSAVNG